MVHWWVLIHCGKGSHILEPGAWSQCLRVRVGYIKTLDHMFSKFKEQVLTLDQRFIS
jgi:hypothetical protein